MGKRIYRDIVPPKRGQRTEMKMWHRAELLRRRMLLSRVSICAIIVISSMLFLSAFAQSQDIRQIGPNTWVAGLPGDEFEEFAAPNAAGRQRQKHDTLARVAIGGFTLRPNWRDSARLRRLKHHSND